MCECCVLSAAMMPWWVCVDQELTCTHAGTSWKPLGPPQRSTPGLSDLGLTRYGVEGWVALLSVHHSESPVIALTRPVDIVQHFHTQHQQRQEDAHKLLAGTRSTAGGQAREEGGGGKEW
jgi:hypothetical protein